MGQQMCTTGLQVSAALALCLTPPPIRCCNCPWQCTRKCHKKMHRKMSQANAQENVVNKESLAVNGFYAHVMLVTRGMHLEFRLSFCCLSRRFQRLMLQQFFFLSEKTRAFEAALLLLVSQATNVFLGPASIKLWICGVQGLVREITALNCCIAAWNPKLHMAQQPSHKDWRPIMVGVPSCNV